VGCCRRKLANREFQRSAEKEAPSVAKQNQATVMKTPLDFMMRFRALSVNAWADQRHAYVLVWMVIVQGE